MRLYAALATAGLTLTLSLAHAEDAPYSGPPDWASRGQVGYAKTTGNTDTATANFLIHAAHTIGDKWKFLMGGDGHYGSTQGETTAQAWEVYGQANYNISQRFFWFVSARYQDDRFSGFSYQGTLSTGAGYQIVKTDATQFSVQVGAGARRLRPEILEKDSVGGIISRTPLEPSTDAVLDAAANYEHAFNANTKVLASVAVESGADNTQTKAAIALQVKMTQVLALAAGVQATRNSQPPAGAVSTDTLSTLNLVYELKNPKLAPE
jgi:putative salt-induced outer membrane protein